MEEEIEMLEVQNNLENPELGSRQVPFGRELYIEREDFMEEPVRKYFRMFPGNEVRLMNAYFVTCTGCEKDENGNITVIHGTYDPESKGGNSPDGRKVKGTIHWVAAKTAVKAECRLYENLIDEEKGVYKGIEKVEVENIVKDYLKIEYRDGGNLYILATGLDVIQKYASADAAKKPKLNKLGGKEWEHTKTKVRSAVSAVAKDLVELYAVRQQSEGYAFGKDTVWQREFEEMFPFEETEDQLSAIADTKADMESHRIMDRLICGDVGYGKTEIAIRAAFKAVQEGKQVVYLVPTTILAQQHYNTFVQRMKEFPVNIALMSRFRTSSEIKKTVKDLEKGLVDIVIGTHRVLSADVKFKDLMKSVEVLILPTILERILMHR